MKDEDLVAGILAWADDNPKFDAAFVQDLKEKLEEYGELTDGQRGALENIVSKWRIDLDEYL